MGLWTGGMLVPRPTPPARAHPTPPQTPQALKFAYRLADDGDAPHCAEVFRALARGDCTRRAPRGGAADSQGGSSPSAFVKQSLLSEDTHADGPEAAGGACGAGCSAQHVPAAPEAPWLAPGASQDALVDGVKARWVGR